MKTEWRCEGCKSTIRFEEEAPMRCFSQGVVATLQLIAHRKKCEGGHYEYGSAVSLEDALLGALEGKHWNIIVKDGASPQ